MPVATGTALAIGGAVAGATAGAIPSEQTTKRDLGPQGGLEATLGGREILGGRGTISSPEEAARLIQQFKVGTGQGKEADERFLKEMSDRFGLDLSNSDIRDQFITNLEEGGGQAGTLEQDILGFRDAAEQESADFKAAEESVKVPVVPLTLSPTSSNFNLVTALSSILEV